VRGEREAEAPRQGEGPRRTLSHRHHAAAREARPLGETITGHYLNIRHGTVHTGPFMLAKSG